MAERLRSSNIESHPRKPLASHLLGVETVARGFSIDTDDELLRKAIGLACLCHDVGKATSYFQKRLIGKAKSHAPEGNHAMFGAIFSYWACKKQGMDDWCLPVALAIARHHGSLKSPRTVFGQSENPHVASILERQVVDLQKSEALHSVCRDADLPDPQSYLEGEWRNCLNELQKIAGDFSIKSVAKRFIGLERRVRLVYSALLYADKKDAGNVSGITIPRVPSNVIDDYVTAKVTDKDKGWLPSPMNDNRTRLRLHAVQRLDSALAKGVRRFQITAPTGSGKTLTAFALATRINEKLGDEGRRIVYCLPFLSIIDQVHDEAQKVFGPANTMAHHHLALPSTPENEMCTINEAWNWYQSWDNRVIISTFQGILDCVFGTINRDMLRRNALRRAIVILDEVQALPAEQWPVARHVLEELDKDGCFIISMSATNPGLVEGAELADSDIPWPADRSIHFHDEEWDNDHLLQQIRKCQGQSRLVVLNTVRRAIEITELLSAEGGKVFHLSTNITPHERRARIEEIRVRLGKRDPIVVVSTQLVEAGVDLDFDVGFREFAPFDSLIQCLGRINRSHDPNREGVLHVFRGDFATRIYGDIRISATRNLSLGNQTREEALPALLDQYYESIKKALSSNQAEAYLESLECLNYDLGRHPVRQWSLIKEDYPKQSVIVAIDAKCRSLINKLRNRPPRQDYESNLATKQLYRQLASYIITVPEKCTRSGLKRLNGPDSPLLLEESRIDELYDHNTNASIGLKTRRPTEAMPDDQFL